VAANYIVMYLTDIFLSSLRQERHINSA